MVSNKCLQQRTLRYMIVKLDNQYKIFITIYLDL